MSKAFKGLTSVSFLENPIICKYGLSTSLRNQRHARFHTQSFGASLGLRQIKVAGPTHSCLYLAPGQSSRCMSILTDLLRRKKPQDDDEEYIPEPDAKSMTLLDDAPKGLTEEEIEAKRNISRLTDYHQRFIHGMQPYSEPQAWFHHTVRYKQKMFGRYGESSGVNPGILWPTREELKEKIEYEKICNPFTIQEMVEKKRAQRKAEKEAVEKRIKEVEAKMAIVDKFKEELAKKHEAKDREASEAKARREKLMEEVRRHFGYTIDPREEKFQELLAKKEKEQKKNLKEARKLEKQQKMLQKLEGKSTKVKEAKKSSTVEASDKDDD